MGQKKNNKNGLTVKQIIALEKACGGLFAGSVGRLLSPGRGIEITDQDFEDHDLPPPSKAKKGGPALS